MFNPSNHEISITSPEQVDYSALALINLVATGYGFQGDAEYLQYQAEMEYGESNQKKYFAYEGEKIVGTLCLAEYSPQGQDSFSQIFWQKIDPEVRQKILEYSSYSCSIHGIVTSPEAQSKGIANQLLARAVEETHPAMILGNTKTPALIHVLAKLEAKGYRIFFGHAEITPHHPQKRTTDHLPILEAYWATREGVDQEKGLNYKSTDVLRPDVPDVARFSPEIQQAFEPIIVAQQEAGTEKTAVGSFIVVHDSILLR